MESALNSQNVTAAYCPYGETVTVIVVCYNCKEHLIRTLDNVRAQTYAHKSVVVVDGGSTDGTCDYLSYQTDITWKSEPDDGIYDAMNKALRMAEGEWVIFMNSGDVFGNDDVLHNVFSETIARDVAFIYSDYSMTLPDGGRKHWITDRSRGVVHHQSAIYRRRLHEKHGYYQVTHPYIISDLLFFLSVPQSSFYKTQHEISLIDGTGVSSGQWSAIQAWGLHVVYGYDTIPKIFLKYVKMQIGYLLRRLKLRK